MAHSSRFIAARARLGVILGAALLMACEAGGTKNDPTATAVAIAAPDHAMRSAFASSSLVPEAGRGAIASSWRANEEAQGLTFGARVPSRASGSFDVGLATRDDVRRGTLADFALRVTHEGYRDRPMIPEGGHVTYKDVAPSTDLLVSTDDAKVEWFYLLEDDRASPRTAMHVALANGIARVRPHDGALDFLDARGHVRLTMPKPYAVDARGERRDVDLGWTMRDPGAHEGELTVTLDPHGLTYPLLVDPSVEHPIWERANVTGIAPQALAFAGMVYDAARGVSLLYGGSSPGSAGTTYFDQTWQWDGNVWTQLDVAGPSARADHGMAYDAARAVTVLFGGTSAFVYLNDTWEWDGTTWTQRTSATAPSVREFPSMTYDAARNVTVLFGGNTHGGTLADTWEWNGTLWSALNPAISPPSRTGAPMTYDPGRQRCVLYGGASSNGSYLNDTWEWDGTNWTKATPTSAPPGREFASLAYDGVRGKTLFFGGEDNGPYFTDTWEWDGTNWAQLGVPATPPGRYGASMAYDSVRKRDVLFAGISGSGPSNDTWEWDGSSWTQRTTTSAPVPRKHAAMAYDVTRAQTVLFGGFTGNAIADTWLWNGTTWSAPTLVAKPTARDGAVMAFDRARGTTVLFGGNIAAPVGDTWEWNGTFWAELHPTTSPSARALAAFAYDATHAVSVLFGGTDASGTIGDTWTWDGTNWTNLAPAQSPPARNSASMDFDTARARAVLFGGNGTSATLGDTWEWNGTTWTQAAPSTSPAARASAMMSFDEVRARSVLFGGASTSLFSDTWEWDGTRWTTASAAIVPERSAATMAFDRARGAAVLFGGIANSGLLNDTWLYFSRGAACTTTSTCDTGFCTDGVCCDHAQCGSCQACNLAGNEGTCTNVSAGTVPTTNDANACASPNLCTIDGACGAPLGGACTSAGTCYSGYCVDGVCCDSACEGACQACSPARGLATSGTCAFAPEATGGRTACGDHFACDGHEPICPSTCADDATCDPGFYCSANGSCVAQIQEGASCNDAAGKDCFGAGCRECAEGHCVDGACCASCQGSAAIGEGCTNDGQCTSNHCIGGACCKDACEALDGGAGASSVCTQGVCLASNGFMCAYPVGTECRAPGCADGVQTFVAVCQSDGACGDLQTKTCAPYVCGSGAKAGECKDSCASNADCASGATCNTATSACENGATCSPDNTEAISNNGSPTLCAPYLCSANKCATSCASIADCQKGFTCNEAGACVAATGVSTNSGGCNVGRRDARDRGWMVALVVLFVVKRRRPRVVSGRPR